jgi:membrane protein DedA with SNARE-associated domain
LINHLTAGAGAWTYPLVFLLVLLDASLFIGFLLPGEAPVPAGLVWAAVFVGLGFWAGEEWRAVARWVDRAGWVFIVGVVVGLGAKWLKGRRRRRVDLCPVPRGRRIESIMEQA